MMPAEDAIATFDGRVWDTKDASRVRTPVLIDSGASFMGYRESLQDSATRAVDAIAAITRRFGVGAVIDAGSSFEAIYRARVVCPDLRIVMGGPTLTDEEPRSESERQIPDAAALARSVAAFACEATQLVSVRTADAALVRSVRAHTELPILLRTSRISPTDFADLPKIALVGAHHVIGLLPQGADILSAIGGLSDGDVIQRARATAESGVALLTGMLALRRSILPREAIESSHIEELIPIYPHARHLVEMRRFGGYLAGRQQLATKAGLKEPSPTQRRLIERGWQLLLTAIAAFADAGGILLPASLSPGIGIVPGFALKEEATLLSHLLSTQRVLTAVTTTAGNFFDVHPNGELTADVESVDDADLILRLRPASLLHQN